MPRKILLALLLASLAALLTYYYINERIGEVAEKVTPLKVLIAKKNIKRGEILNIDKVLISEIPSAYIMPGAISASTEAGLKEQWQEGTNQLAIVPIAKGEQILPNKLSEILPGFASVIPKGKRIIALEFSSAAAVGGHIKPGNQVDILASFKHQYKGDNRTTVVNLAQNIMIAAVSESTLSNKKNGFKSKQDLLGAHSNINVSLIVTPQQALKINLAQVEGKISLSLRSLGEEEILDLPDQNLGRVLGPLMKVSPEEISSEEKEIQIISGL